MPVVLNLERCRDCGKFYRQWELSETPPGTCKACFTARFDRQLAASFASLDLIKKAADDNGIRVL